MGRPLAKRFFGNTDVDKVGGELASTVALTAANNSTGFTNGSTTQATFSAPQIAGGTTATGTIVAGPAGALLQTTANTGTGTTFTYSGTGVSTTTTVWSGLTQKTSSGSGTGAVFTVTRTASTTTYSGNTTVTVTSKGTGYAVADTVTIDGAVLGGVTTTNDLVITIAGSVAVAGTVTGITITNVGSGYTTAPTITFSTGTIGTLTATVSLTSSQQDAIVCQGITSGSTNRTSGNDIIKQVSTRRYKIQTQDGTAICTLKASAPSAAGEMAIVATDASSGTYYVTKLTKNTATLTRGTGTVYTDGAAVPWTFGTATATVCKIPSA
jgi:hypothetical protein